MDQINKKLAKLTKEKVIDQSIEVDLAYFKSVKELEKYLVPYKDWSIIYHDWNDYPREYYLVSYREETDEEFEERKLQLKLKFEREEEARIAEIKKLEAELAKLKKS